MKITLIQALLIGIVYYLGNIGTPWLSLLGSISVVYKTAGSRNFIGFIYETLYKDVSSAQQSTCRM